MKAAHPSPLHKIRAPSILLSIGHDMQLGLYAAKKNSANALKGPCHEIFDLRWFFHQTTPSGPLTHGLKPFCIWLRIRGDI
jgi:hypothetical protein